MADEQSDRSDEPRTVPSSPAEQDLPSDDPSVDPAGDPTGDATGDDTGDDTESADIFPTVDVDVDDAVDVADLARAEQAVARNGGTAEQRDGVELAATVRRAEDRLVRWRSRRRP